MIMAVIGPALVGSLKAQRQVREALEPMAAEQVALTLLRDDLLTAPKPNGSLCQPMTLVSGQVNGLRADTLIFTTNGRPPLHSSVAVSAPEIGQAVVTWAAHLAEDKQGLAWTRSRNANLLATGATPEPVAEVLMDHLAQISLEALVGETWSDSFDSEQNNQELPLALRLRFSYLAADGTPGPLRTVVMDLPQVALGGGG